MLVCFFSDTLYDLHYNKSHNVEHRFKKNTREKAISPFLHVYFVSACWHTQQTAWQKWLGQSCHDPLCSKLSHCWQLSEVMQPHLWRAKQTCLFIKAKGKMKGQRELEWPVWRERFKVKENSSGLYGDKGKIMSTENSPWEGIMESSIRLPYCCFWLSHTSPCARMKCLEFLIMTRAHLQHPLKPNLNNIPS